MGFFEFLGEKYNPGNTGYIEREEPEGNPDYLPYSIIIIKFIVTLFIVWLSYFLFSGDISPFVFLSLFWIIYIPLSLHFTPEPDYDNMGLLGGLFDNPFRYSDDVNRWLWSLKLLLLPGKFIGQSFLDTQWMLEDIIDDLRINKRK